MLVKTEVKETKATHRPTEATPAIKTANVPARVITQIMQGVQSKELNHRLKLGGLTYIYQHIRYLS
jgi:hypothetical protein